MTDRAPEDPRPLLSGPLERSWTSPQCVALGRLPMRPPLVPFPDADSARSGDRCASPWHHPLDGTWRFRLFERPEAVPAEAVHPELDDEAWDTIGVPGCWTMQGHDRPHYTNVQMPWRCEPPSVPETNPTGVYRRRFELRAGWASRRSVLCLGGAESVAYVYCNGAFVGMGKDSRLASEFDLSPFVRDGTNQLSVVVVRWSDGTWLEDQDHWFHAGLHREVSLHSTDAIWLADVVTDAERLAEGRGRLRVAATLGSADVLAPGWSLEVRLENARGRPLRRKPWRADFPVLDRSSLYAEHVQLYAYPGPIAEIDTGTLAVACWSHETPVRYRLISALIDPDGRTREVVAQWVGFRSVRIRDGELLLNDRPVPIRGVNRHDHHPETGKTVSVQDMRADLVAMKRFGMNAVRTAHYPNDPRLLDLADELGLWVIDEANVECHARWASLLQDDVWSHAVMERVKRMVVRDRSHACVMGWSLGNESGYAPVHDAAAAWIRRVDPSRFVHYEGALHESLDHGRVGDGGHAASDVVCPMYPPIEALRAWAKKTDGRRPLIMCEYSHAMGNSNGSLHDYWRTIEETPGLQGGFVWDWKDQGLLRTHENGRRYYAFGGHFGDEPNDANFCCNGLVGPDGTPHPGAFEHAKLAEIVRAEPVALGRGRLRIVNRQSFRDLAWLRARWQVEVDGRRVQSGALALPDLAPGGRAPVELPIERLVLEPGETATLTIRFLTRSATAWAPRGFEVAASQLVLPGRRPSRRKAAARAVRRSASAAGVQLDPATGTLLVGDRLVGTPRPCLWRAPTDNDGVRQGWMSPVAGVRRRWLEWGLDRLEERVTGVARRGRSWVVERQLTGSGGLAARHRQTIRIEHGVAQLDEQIEVPGEWSDLPRVGVRLVVDGRFHRLEWLGLGPHACYPDRMASVRFGRFASTVADQYEPYAVPQEHGAHQGTHWLTLCDEQGRGVRVSSDAPFSFSALHHSLEQLGQALCTAELEASDDVHVQLDAAIRGVGTGACGPDTLPAYRVRPGRHRWRWRIEAI